MICLHVCGPRWAPSEYVNWDERVRNFRVRVYFVMSVFHLLLRLVLRFLASSVSAGKVEATHTHTRAHSHSGKARWEVWNRRRAVTKWEAGNGLRAEGILKFWACEQVKLYLDMIKSAVLVFLSLFHTHTDTHNLSLSLSVVVSVSCCVSSTLKFSIN